MAAARPDRNGGWAWEPLRESAPRQGGRVWPTEYRLFATADGVAAVGNRGDHHSIAGWRAARGGNWTLWSGKPDENIRQYAAPQDVLYELAGAGRLRRWTGEKWQFDRVLSLPADFRLAHLSAVGGGQLQLVDRNGAVFTSHPDGSVRQTELRGANGPVSWVVHARSLSSGGFVVADREARVLIFQKDGSLAGEVDASSGLPAGSIDELFVDQAGRIWVSAAGQVAFINLPGHLTRFDRNNGLSAPAVHDIARHKGRLHVATDAGIYRLIPVDEQQSGAARFRRMSGPDARVTALLSHGDALLAGSAEGVLALRGDQFELIADSPAHVTGLVASIADPATVYASSHHGIAMLKRTSGGWHMSGPIDQVPLDKFWKPAVSRAKTFVSKPVIPPVVVRRVNE